jgi:hypothetical protein
MTIALIEKDGHHEERLSHWAEERLPVAQLTELLTALLGAGLGVRDDRLIQGLKTG